MASRTSTQRSRTVQQPSIFETDKLGDEDYSGAGTFVQPQPETDVDSSKPQLLEAINISCAPLVAQRREENPTVILPAEDAGRFSEKTWVGEPLKLILDSARRDGEDVLDYLQSAEAEISRAAGHLQGTKTVTQAQDEIKQSQEATQAAWQALIYEMASALAEKRVGQSISAALEAFNAAISLPLGHVAQLSIWEVMQEQAPPVKTGRGGKITQYPVHTSEEWQEILHATSDGRALRHYITNVQTGTLRHQRPNTAFFTELELSEEERRAGFDTSLLQQAASALDADDGLICLYISQLLAPPGPLPPNVSASGWIDLNDVAIKALGGYAPNEAEAEKRRAKVYNALRYFTRANIGGQRKVPYYDKQTKREISTEIHGTPWQIVSRQNEIPTLFPTDGDNVPVRVELVASRRWTELTTHPSTAQYLPYGELIGAIPCNQPSGAWARVLGLAYLYWCRVHLTEVLQGATPHSRRSLLDQYPSKVAPYEEVLASKNPRRALDYWRNAEGYLCETGLIEVSDIIEELPRKNWREQWLNASPPWQPGPRLRPTLEALTKNKHLAKPRALQRLQTNTPRKKRVRNLENS